MVHFILFIDNVESIKYINKAANIENLKILKNCYAV